MIKIFISFLIITHTSINAEDCSLYLKKKLLTENSFATSRSLTRGKEYGDAGYFSAFGNDFRDKLLGFNNKHHWIDSGAGDGAALMEYLHLKGKAKLTAISYTPTDNLLQNIVSSKGRIKLIKEKLLENISVNHLDKADIITDFFGPISYTDDLSSTLAKYFELIKHDGEIFIRISNSYQRTTVRIESNSLELLDYLQTLPGVDAKTHRFFNNGEYIESLVLSPTNSFNPSNIPNLKLTKYESGSPPTRVFEVISSTQSNN